MNGFLLVSGLLIASAGIYGNVRPMSPIIRNLSPPETWKRDPERAEQVHRNRAMGFGKVMVAVGLAFVACGLLT